MTFSPRKARTPMKRVNRKRKSKSYLRAYGSEERVEFVKSLPCIVASCFCWGEIQNAHVVKGDGGASYKASAQYVAPLCVMHHDTLHHEGPRSFQFYYGIDLAACAAETEAAWLRSQEGAC